MLRYFTTGESHGQYLATIIEGIPSGLRVSLDAINQRLADRQQGYGRGGRQKIETDRVEILGGVVRGLTTGAPVGFLLKNKDFKIDSMPDLFRPRPGHADLVGALKYGQPIRPVLERSSARETAMRVAVGALAELLLKEVGIEVIGHVIRIGSVSLPRDPSLTVGYIRKVLKNSETRCVCKKTSALMKAAIDEARRKKNTLGGQYEVRASGVPIGLGSYVHHERKLDGRLAQHLMSMQSVKAVEIGDGTRLGECFGSEAHDEIFYSKKKGYYHETNRCGGMEGGTTNGNEIVVKVTMKPISTLGQPLRSVNMKTKKQDKADFERSDVCAVPAGSVIGTAILASVLADAFLEKFGGDSLGEIKRNYDHYLKSIHE